MSIVLLHNQFPLTGLEAVVIFDIAFIPSSLWFSQLNKFSGRCLSNYTLPYNISYKLYCHLIFTFFKSINLALLSQLSIRTL